MRKRELIQKANARSSLRPKRLAQAAPPVVGLDIPTPAYEPLVESDLYHEATADFSEPIVDANQATHGSAAPADRPLIQLQRRYGNHIVQRMVARTRQGEGENEVAPKIEEAIQRARGGGQMLDSSVRRQMDSFFEADFGSVRVHTDDEADTLSRALDARAFTIGQDIFFRDGEYNPANSRGRELLAHELAHVVQQGDGAQYKLAIGTTDDEKEWAAEQVTREFVQHDQHSVPTPNNQCAVQRHTCGGEQRTLYEYWRRTPRQKQVQLSAATTIGQNDKKPQPSQLPKPESRLFKDISLDSPTFWKDLKGETKLKLVNWLASQQQLAVSQFETDLREEKGEEINQSLFSLKVLDALLNIPAKIPAVAAGQQIAQAIIELALHLIESVPKDKPVSLANFLNKYRESIAQNSESLLREDHRTINEIEKYRQENGENNLEGRKQALNVVNDAISVLPGYKATLQALVTDWTSSSRAEETGILGYISLHCKYGLNWLFDLENCFSQYWFFSSMPQLENVERPEGAVLAIKQAFGEEEFLDHLPLEMRITVYNTWAEKNRLTEFKKLAKSLDTRKQPAWSLESGDPEIMDEFIALIQRPKVRHLQP